MADASVSSPFEIAEDEYTVCPCTTPEHPVPAESCLWCVGSGYRLTRRLMRPVQKPTFDEQAALAIIRTKDTAISKAAQTIEYAATLFEKLGHLSEAGQTKAAAKALRQSMEG